MTRDSARYHELCNRQRGRASVSCPGEVAGTPLPRHGPQRCPCHSAHGFAGRSARRSVALEQPARGAGVVRGPHVASSLIVDSARSRRSWCGREAGWLGGGSCEVRVSFGSVRLARSCFVGGRVGQLVCRGGGRAYTFAGFPSGNLRSRSVTETRMRSHWRERRIHSIGP